MRQLLTLLLMIGTGAAVVAQTDTRARGTQTGTVQAGARTVRGSVVDAAGEPLTGASVSVINRTTGSIVGGTYTDGAGSFQVSVPSEGDFILRVSYVGSKSQDLAIGTRESFSIKLEGETALDEVVISGLASTTTRGNAATSVGIVNAEQLTGTTRPNTLDNALSGKVLGATITQTSGAPGGGVSVKLRGISSISLTSEPLYVVDGVIMNNNSTVSNTGNNYLTGAGTGQDNNANRIADINPADIEEVQILKGPAAAAIYGLRANAGVIYIRTKRGQAGKTKVNFRQDVGFINATKFLYPTSDFWTDERVNLVWPGELSNFQTARAAGKLYNYEREYFGNTGTLYETNLSVSGGNERTTFYLSGTSHNETGIMQRTGYSRNSLSARASHKIADNFTVDAVMNLVNSESNRGFNGNDNNGVSVAYNQYSIPAWAELHANPVTGVFPDNDYGSENPLAVIERMVNRERVNHYFGSVSMDWMLFSNDRSFLKLNALGGFDVSYVDNFAHAPSDMQYQRSTFPASQAGVSAATSTYRLQTNWQAFLVYNWQLGGINLNSQVGVTRFATRGQRMSTIGRGLPLKQTNPQRGATQSLEYTDGPFTYDVGFSLQQDFNWKDRVVGAFGVRADRTSLNGNNEKLYYFPRANVAVNLTKFDFWSVPFITMLKPRIAWGQSGGVANFGDYTFTTATMNIGGNAGVVFPSTIPNKNVMFERKQEIELGLDMGVWDNKIRLEFNYFRNKTMDFLGTFILAPSVGYYQVNSFPIGDLENRGFEIGLVVTPIDKPNFSYTSTINFTKYTTEVTRLIVPEIASYGRAFGGPYGQNPVGVGKNPSDWYGTDLDGKIRKFGSSQPDFEVSWNSNVTFLKNFQFNMLWIWRKGQSNSQFATYYLDYHGNSPDYFDPSPVAGYQYLGQYRASEWADKYAGYYITDASFIRLREIGLKYSLPASMFEGWTRGVVKGMSLGVSAYNLVTITKYPGYDPEVSNFGVQTIGGQQDLLSYPNTRRVMFSLNVQF